MASDQFKGHLAVAIAYTIFGLNVVLCKDIANSEAVSPYVLFTFRALGASALFWLVSLFLPEEKIQKGDLWRIALASFLGLFLTQMAQSSFLILSRSPQRILPVRESPQRDLRSGQTHRIELRTEKNSD